MKVNNKKKILMVFISLIVIVLFFILKNKTSKISLTPYKIYQDYVYRNKKYGFQVIMPKSWKKYGVKEDVINDQWIKFHFGLPLKTTDGVARWLSEPERTEKVFKIIDLDMMTISQWEKEQKKCEGIDYPCFPPREIIRNNKYAFGTSEYFTGGGWDPCALSEDSKKESYFCKVYKDLGSENYFIQNFFLLK